MVKYNVIFLGTTNFSATILEGLVKNPLVNLQLIITQPDRPQGRKQKLIKNPVKIWAEKNNIAIQQPQKLKTIGPLINCLNSDFLITAAYGQIVPQEILESAKIEALNVHGSLLPTYRGGSPVQTAIWNGDQKSGVSIMRMTKKMDAGPIFGQKGLKIDSNMNSGELMEQLAEIGKNLLNELLIPIANHEIKPWNQEETKVTFAHNINPEQELINWDQSSFKIHNQIRALAPHPGAYMLFNKKRLKIFKTKVLNKQTEFSPKTISQINKHSFEVQTKDGVLEILEVQQAGKNRIDAGLFAMNNLKIGDQFNND